MPQINFQLPFEINSQLAISPEELDRLYFFGVGINDGAGGKISREDKIFYIQNAQKEVENYLEIKLNKQIIKENFNYSSNDFKQFNYIRTSYPVVKPFKLNGFINSLKQVEYPSEWLSAKKTNDPIGYNRQINLVPSGAEQGVKTSNIVFNGIFPFVGYAGAQTVPNYWETEYCTGFDKVPEDILQIIGYLAAIPLFAIAGDLIIGAGIASQSLSIDGLSSSLSTTSSATNAGYGARIIEYRKTIDKTLPMLRNRYVGYKFMSV